MNKEELHNYCKEASNEIIKQDEEIRILKKENQELKKQLEEINYTIIPNCDIRPLIDKFRTQQKEFIKWLEDESKEVYRDGGLRQNIFRQILQKYKEIIGGK